MEPGLPPPPTSHSPSLFNTVKSTHFCYLSDLCSKPWTVSQCQWETPKYKSIHCNIFTWRENAPSLFPYTRMNKYPFILYNSKPIFEMLGNTQHKPVWAAFQPLLWPWASCKTVCWSVRGSAWSLRLLCNISLHHWMKTWGLSSSLSPYPLNPQTMEFSIRKRQCSTRRGKISFLFSFFCPL